MSNPDGSWTPDWDELERQLPSVYGIVSAFLKMEAESGWVRIRREDLLTARTALRAAPRLAEEVLERLDIIYEATAPKLVIYPAYVVTGPTPLGQNKVPPPKE